VTCFSTNPASCHTAVFTTKGRIKNEENKEISKKGDNSYRKETKIALEQ
jgi:hypothetical protein